MDLTNFTEKQRKALVDLMVLTMYADGHIASAEEARVHRLLGTLGFETDYDRSRQFDAAVTRLRRHSATAQAARTHAAQLARSFATPEQRRQVADLLEDLTGSDNQVAPAESQFLAAVKEALQI
jgi:uncharacterized tellurite resistance protein B-like protein